MSRAVLIGLYLAAIVAANLSVTHWGPKAVLWNALILIGLDLSCRDRLHDMFRPHLARNLAALILAGSALSYIVNRDTARIALASCIAFGAAAVADTLVYHWRRRRPWEERANTSNIAGAVVDSIVFPAIAFGFPLSATFVMSLASVKIAGGYVWSLILRERGNEWEQRNKALYGHLKDSP